MTLQLPFDDRTGAGQQPVAGAQLRIPAAIRHDPTLPDIAVWAPLGDAVQDASERSRDLARLERLGEELTDAGGERLLCQEWTAIAAHQHDRQVGPLAA